MLAAVRPLRQPHGTQFREFVAAAVPGAVFNFTAMLLLLALRWPYGTIDRRLVAALFDLSTAGNAFSEWIKKGSLLGPSAHLAAVIIIAIVWSSLAVQSLKFLETKERPHDVPFGSFVFTLVILLPFIGYVSDRFELLDRDVAIKLDNGKVIFGRSQSFEFASDKLVAVVVRDAKLIATEQELAEEQDTLGAQQGASFAYQTYIPADKISCIIALARHQVSLEDLSAAVTLLELSRESVKSDGA